MRKIPRRRAEFEPTDGKPIQRIGRRTASLHPLCCSAIRWCARGGHRGQGSPAVQTRAIGTVPRRALAASRTRSRAGARVYRPALVVPASAGSSKRKRPPKGGMRSTSYERAVSMHQLRAQAKLPLGVINVPHFAAPEPVEALFRDQFAERRELLRKSGKLPRCWALGG